ncbi:MAG: pentapeptide repeat-containing protein [Treponema sp.]|nr:pentapeptide repeat-containing protein [Treponema sp.]
MFTTNKCRCPECNNPALTTIRDNELFTEENNFCYDHLENKEEYMRSLKEYIESHEKIVGLCACGIYVRNMDLSNKRFYGCNFQHVTFTNVHSENIRLRMCMMDFSTLTDCNFPQSNIQFSSFAGSKLVHTSFTGSDLIHNNFNGTTCYQCSFDNSDLYNSRFIKAILLNTSIRDCNLKKTIFFESARDKVLFKLSNTREALFDRNKTNSLDELGNEMEEGDL